MKGIVNSESFGNFTLPGESGQEKLTIKLANKWGADAIRDSDGTVLSDEILDLGRDIYSTVCLVRMDNEFAKANRDKLQQKFYMSKPILASGNITVIDLMNDVYEERHMIDEKHDPKKLWQVFNRSTGDEVPNDMWDFDAGNKTVTIRETLKGCRYTVNFLVYEIWEGVSMVNHLWNDWGDKEHLMPVDPRHPEVQENLFKVFKQWLDEHPATQIVRLTSLFYLFSQFVNSKKRKGMWDWTGYHDCMSIRALDDFEKVKGYRLCSEDFISNGTLNVMHAVPSKAYLDWIDFNVKFVVDLGRKFVDMIHQAGKTAMFFYCDHYIGAEPLLDYFENLNVDAVVIPCVNAQRVRLLSELPDRYTKEVRLYPYFFPVGMKNEPIFKEGGDPVTECRDYWINIRRSMVRNCVDRIGFGGYLSLAAKFPEFLEYVEVLANEFRSILWNGGKKSHMHPQKIAVLTAWGKMRAWINDGIRNSQFHECLAGLPFDVEFIDFDDLVNGLPDDISVIVNAGEAGTSHSGGEHWKRPEVLAAITDFIRKGGGFVGIEEPTAVPIGKWTFQLAEVFGLDRDPNVLNNNFWKEPYNVQEHYITEDCSKPVKFSNPVKNIYLIDDGVKVLAEQNGAPVLATHTFAKGRVVYMAGFDFSFENNRMLHRSLLWAAKAEEEIKVWNTSNIQTECAYYPDKRSLIVLNPTAEPQTTLVYDFNKKAYEVTVEPYASEWKHF